MFVGLLPERQIKIYITLTLFFRHVVKKCSSASAHDDDTPKYIKRLFTVSMETYLYLQCFDAVGWVAGRASGL